MDHLLNFNRQQLIDWFKSHNMPAFRADQILQWVYSKNAPHWDRMTNLPADLRNQLAGHFQIRSAEIRDRQTAPDGAVKLLLQWPDDTLTETILIPAEDRNTVCLSTQIGCPVRCKFCASGLMGLQRSLLAGEIVEQCLHAADHLSAVSKDRITNIVIMGMGEPFVNYDNTLDAVRILNADWGLNIGARRITISTIGLPDRIRQLADENLQITLAVSLHAPDDALRRQLIPWAKNISLEKIFNAIDDYFRKTHREVTLEYVLLKGVNCSLVHADRLADLARKSRCNVNLINYNGVPETGFEPADPQTVDAFIDRLKHRAVNVHLRRSLGDPIRAACGQLRLQHL